MHVSRCNSVASRGGGPDFLEGVGWPVPPFMPGAAKLLRQHFTCAAWAVAYMDVAGCVGRGSGIGAAAG
jgi:hypothetical protein